MAGESSAGLDPRRWSMVPRSQSVLAMIFVFFVGTSCSGPTYRMQPEAPLEAREQHLDVRVDSLEVALDSKARPSGVNAWITVTNHGEQSLAFQKKKLRFQDGESETAVTGRREDGKAKATGSLGSPGSGAGVGGSTGSSMSGGSTSSAGGAIGGGLGAIGGAALALVLAIPVGLYAAVKLAVEHPPGELDPGETERFKLELGNLGLRDDKPQYLMMGAALGLDEPVAVPLNAHEHEHGGYGPPRRGEYFGARIGGGPIYYDEGRGGVGVRPARHRRGVPVPPAERRPCRGE